MIKVWVCLAEENDIFWFKIQGHALYASKGHDVVCAAISAQISLVELGIKGVLEEDFLFVKASSSVCIIGTKKSQLLMKSLYLSVKAVEKVYSKNIYVKEIKKGAFHGT